MQEIDPSSAGHFRRKGDTRLSIPLELWRKVKYSVWQRALICRMMKNKEPFIEVLLRVEFLSTRSIRYFGKID